MQTKFSDFRSLPATVLGKRAMWVSLSFLLLFVPKYALGLPVPAMLIMAIGIVGGVMTLLALAWKRDLSWVLWLLALPGLFAILFSLGELLFPH